MKIYKIINYADVVTLLNSAAGLSSIFFTLQEKFLFAAWALVIAAAFDCLDGKIARFLHEETSLGRELDSLSDVVSFGVAPAVFVFSVFFFAGTRAGSWMLVAVWILCSFFILCGALRLARFNVSYSLSLKGVYEGMPITMNGILFPVLWFASAPQWLYAVAMLASSLLMVSSIRIRKII